MMAIELEVHECEMLLELLSKTNFNGTVDQLAQMVDRVNALRRKVEGALNGNRSTATPRPTLVQPERAPLES
jgi:hypothetical protein